MSLRIYVAADCFTCATARRLAERVRRERPGLALEVVDIDAPAADVPAAVFGTPTYMWDETVLFLGNPTEEELFRRIDALVAPGG